MRNIMEAAQRTVERSVLTSESDQADNADRQSVRGSGSWISGKRSCMVHNHGHEKETLDQSAVAHVKVAACDGEFAFADSIKTRQT